MNVSVLVASYGDQGWKQLALRRAVASTIGQGALETIPLHLPEGTLAQARNAAASKAQGEWLCFLDPDDELADGYLAAMSDRRRAYQFALLVPRVQYLRDGIEEEPIFPNREKPMSELNHCVIGTLVQRRLFFKVGGFQTHDAYEDWAMFLACVRAGAALIDVPSAIYRAHVSPTGRNAVPNRDAYWRIRREHEESFLT